MNKQDVQKFFKERLIELLHKDSLDSYRVRTHNAFSLLKELYTLIPGWQRKQIKQFATVTICIDEIISSLKKDSCLDFSYYDKELFIEQLTNYKKTGEKEPNIGNKILFHLNRCIDNNKQHYFDNLFKAIEELLFFDGEKDNSGFIPVITSTDNVLSALCCELICQGYSKTYLYHLATKIFENDISFENQYDQFKSFIIPVSKKDFVVIFRIHSPHPMNNLPEFPEYVNHIEDIYLNHHIKTRYKRFIRPNNSIIFYITNISAVDSFSAAIAAKEKLSISLDILHLGVSSLNVNIRDSVLVLEKKEGSDDYVYNYDTKSLLDGTYSNDIELSKKLKADIDKINQDNHIQQDVKDRLNSAIRHLRIANTNVEIEQQFINYWIALEFIFSSPETNENTFSRLRSNLVNIFSCCYVKRNLYDLNETLIKRGFVEKGELYWEKENQDEFIATITSPLLKFHLLKMKSRLQINSDKRKEYIMNHRNNLEQHITRVYRMRNELIHEAAIRQDIESITSNLRYYLVFTLNQIIAYCSSRNTENDIRLEDFFLEFDLIWNIIEQKKYNMTDLLKVNIVSDLLK
ncbi:MAG: hypothetical protein ACRCX4_12010 [Bacteroidales bacterium]